MKKSLHIMWMSELRSICLKAAHVCETCLRHLKSDSQTCGQVRINH